MGPEVNRKTLRSDSFALLGALTVQLLVVYLVRSAGFSGISDDDAARVVIAQEFAHAPTLDPSGTSWLPIPFLLTGSLMKVLGASLAAARFSAVLGALLACSLLFFAGRILGARPWTAAISAAAAASLPISAHLAAATVPEYPTAAGIVFGVATLEASERNRSSKLRVLGGLSFFICCGSRYETWPAALAFGAFQLWDARQRPRRTECILSAALACAFPPIWLLHGLARHGDALFFVKRVVDYKEAYGSDATIWSALLVYPEALVTTAPEITGLAVCYVSLLLFFSWRGAVFRVPLRPAVVFASLFAFLLLGAARGGAPTHHPERALLGIWLFVAVASGAAWDQLERQGQKRAFGMALGVGIFAGLISRWAIFSEHQPYANRQHEERLGAWLNQEVQDTTPIALALPDYGYFSVMAAAEHPERFEILRRHDPREMKLDTSLSALLDRFREQGGCYWVGTEKEASGSSRILMRSGSLAVMKLTQCESPYSRLQ